MKEQPSITVEKQSDSTFNCCRVAASFIFSLLACSATAVLLAFWIMKSADGFNSCPFSLYGSCSSAYFLYKYSNEMLPLVVFVAMATAGACQLVLIALYLWLLCKTVNPSSSMRIALGVFSSLGGLASIIPAGFTISFLLQIPRFSTYGCFVSYDFLVSVILCASASASLLFHLIEHILLLTDTSGSEVQTSNNRYELARNNTNISDHQSLFAPEVREREKILYKRSKISSSKKLDHEIFQDNNSFAELKSPSNDNRTAISKAPKTETYKNQQYLSDFIYREEPMSRKNPNSYVLPLQQEKEYAKMPRRVIRNPSQSLRVRPQLRELAEQEEEMSDLSNNEAGEPLFVPTINFAYPRNSRSPTRNYNLKRNSKSSKIPNYRDIQADFVRTQEREDSPIERASRRTRTPARLERAIDQIHKNYERRLNIWQAPSQ